MKILFLDQSGNLGGAELCLLDIVRGQRDRHLVGLLTSGPFKTLLEQHQIPVQVLPSRFTSTHKKSGFIQGLRSFISLWTVISQVTQLSQAFDLIYANTPKMLVVGAIASFLSRRPLVYHLHDIISPDHFSAVNRQVMIRLANTFAALVIANSQATQDAFVAAGGRSSLVTVVYNGFESGQYQIAQSEANAQRQQLGLQHQFVVGHFSRLSPWKGQHVLIEALAHCPENVSAILVGDALFGEHNYVQQLHHRVQQLGLEHRVHFLGFRSDVPELMAMCDLVTHTSTAPEPFGRVIVEAMLCGTPVVAAADGAAIELVEQGKTGWLVPPSDPLQLAAIIQQCQQQSATTESLAHYAQQQAKQRFDLIKINRQMDHCLSVVAKNIPIDKIGLTGNKAI